MGQQSWQSFNRLTKFLRFFLEEANVKTSFHYQRWPSKSDFYWKSFSPYKALRYTSRAKYESASNQDSFISCSLYCRAILEKKRK